MDFFKAQEQARKKTRWLVVLFVLAAVGIMASTYLGLSLFLYAFHDWGDDNFKLKFLAILSLAIFLIYVSLYSEFDWDEEEYNYNWETGKYDLHERKIDELTRMMGIPCLFLILTILAHLNDKYSPTSGHWALWVCMIVGGIIAVASLYKIMQISRSSGRLIAEQLGGRKIMRDTANPTERRLLNVIDEMAIAAGIPAPIAFVLDNEPGANAFAAGLSTHDSTIGVTRGLLEAMSRDELQGVIAHEISHIVNGDSRLNLKLIGYLYGVYVLTITGRNFLALIGHPIAALPSFFLCLVGSVGLFFGRLIQATSSREREHLADAAAVQFTRNPAGLVSALQKMRTSGSQIQHPEAVVASHLFLGASDMPGTFETFLTTHLGLSLLATHPPLGDRIRRLGGFLLHQSDKEEFLRPPPIIPFEEDHHLPILTANPHAGMPVPVPPPVVIPIKLPEEITPASLNRAQLLLASLPNALREQSHSATGAIGILAGLLFSRQPSIRAQQEKLLPSDALPTAQELYQWLTEQPECGARYRLVWLDLILPTLREVLFCFYFKR